MKNQTKNIKLSLALLLFAMLVLTPAANAAQISTDQEDYGPDEIVYISGNGFDTSTVITVTITGPDGWFGEGQDGYPDVDKFYSDDSPWYAYWDFEDPNVDFNIGYLKVKCGGTFTVVVKDEAGNSATATFTDSDVDVAVVDVTTPTGSVTLAQGGSGPIIINMIVTGRQDHTATFKIYRDWTLSGGTFTGSNEQVFNVPTRGFGQNAPPPYVYQTTGTVTVASNQATGGPFTLAIGAFDIETEAPGALAAKNSSNYQVTVTAASTPLTITAPSDITVERNAVGGAIGVDLGTPTVSGGTPPYDDVINDAPDVFPLGDTTVTWTVTDAIDITATDTQIVTVTDTAPPTITAPLDITVEGNTTGGATGVDLGTPTVSGGTPPYTITNNAPETFPLGSTTVTWTATDAFSHSATDIQTVTVVDTTPPVLFLPADMTPEATGPAGAVVSFTATALDAVDGAVLVTCVPDSGGTFPLGETIVNCSAVDSAGNTATGSFTVTVVDTTPPTITAPANITVEGNTAGGATGIVLVPPTVSDIVDPDPDVTNNAPSFFPLGDTVVTWTATDFSGNSATATQTVTVVDTTPPEITITTPADGAVYLLNEVVDADWTAEDAVSGIASSSGTVPSGSPIATNPAGIMTFTVTATDNAGNEATKEVTYYVQYDFLGFFSPVDNPPVVNVGKAGRTFPIKWQLKDDNGSFISDLSVVESLKYWKTADDFTAPSDVMTGDTSGASGLRYDSFSNQYIFTWQTAKITGSYVFVLTLDDGTEHIARFRFAK